MRTLLTILLSLALFTSRAQLHYVPATGWGYTPWQPFVPYSALTNGNTSGHGFYLQPFTSVSLGYMFLGGGITYVSAPVGVMLYYPLNNNFTAFGAATVAPTAFHFSSLYGSPYGLANPGNSRTAVGVNAAVSGGIIYTNDAKTFSISGSISVERGSYPVYTAPRTTARKQY